MIEGRTRMDRKRGKERDYDRQIYSEVRKKCVYQNIIAKKNYWSAGGEGQEAKEEEDNSVDKVDIVARWRSRVVTGFPGIFATGSSSIPAASCVETDTMKPFRTATTNHSRSQTGFTLAVVTMGFISKGYIYINLS